MAPCRPSRDVKLTVPRFNSKKASPKVVREVVSIAKREKIKVDVKQTVDPTTALALAIVSLTPSFSSAVPTGGLGKCVGVEFPAHDRSR